MIVNFRPSNLGLFGFPLQAHARKKGKEGEKKRKDGCGGAHLQKRKGMKNRKKREEKERKIRLRDAVGMHFFAKEKTENELFMTVDHFGSGGRRSDSRLGRREKKLQESRKNLGI